MWNATHYLRYRDERTRPALDLISRVAVENPTSVIDIGCGPGNSTQVLKARWPDARIRGLDQSNEMIAAAREQYPHDEWILADASEWMQSSAYDVVFSNAALQWISDHDRLIRRLFALVTAGGALAFQVPSDEYATVRRLIHEVAEDPEWRDRMDGAKSRLTMQTPTFYYDLLADKVRDIDIWETEYSHVMENAACIVDWIASTGLRPFLEALDDRSQRDRFIELLHARVQQSYPQRRDGRVLFPFRRLFVIAYN